MRNKFQIAIHAQSICTARQRYTVVGKSVAGSGNTVKHTARKFFKLLAKIPLFTRGLSAGFPASQPFSTSYPVITLPLLRYLYIYIYSICIHPTVTTARPLDLGNRRVSLRTFPSSPRSDTHDIFDESTSNPVRFYYKNRTLSTYNLVIYFPIIYIVYAAYIV